LEKKEERGEMQKKYSLRKKYEMQKEQGEEKGELKEKSVAVEIFKNKRIAKGRKNKK
jgi:hypothetical protein